MFFSIIYLLVSRFHQYHTIQDGLSELVNTTVGRNLQAVGRDSVVLHQNIHHCLCTFQAQLLVELRSTCGRVGITVYGVSRVREFLHLFGQIRDVHHLTRRHLGRTYIEEYGTRRDIRIGNDNFSFSNLYRSVLCSGQSRFELLVGSSHFSNLLLHGREFKR